MSNRIFRQFVFLLGQDGAMIASGEFLVERGILSGRRDFLS
jgi:hypothetical protein